MSLVRFRQQVRPPATWSDSWFEAGTRLFYVVPQRFVDRVLPLDISPRPAETTRVFVARTELVTPFAENEIRSSGK